MTRTITFACPICEEMITAEIDPGRYDANPHEAEAPTVESMDGCEHARAVFEVTLPLASMERLVSGALEAWERREREER